MKLQSDTGRIALLYYAKSVNIMGNYGGISNTEDISGLIIDCYNSK